MCDYFSSYSTIYEGMSRKHHPEVLSKEKIMVTFADSQFFSHLLQNNQTCCIKQLARYVTRFTTDNLTGILIYFIRSIQSATTNGPIPSLLKIAKDALVGITFMVPNLILTSYYTYHLMVIIQVLCSLNFKSIAPRTWDLVPSKCRVPMCTIFTISENEGSKRIFHSYQATCPVAFYLV